MNDDEFEDLLARAGATTTVRVATLDRLVEDARRPQRRKRGRKPLVITLAVTGAVLLAAAATSDAWKHIAPFQSLENGMYRTQTSIPVDYVEQDGVHESCTAFLEFIDLSTAQAAQADAYVEQHDWAGLGQRAYDAHPGTDISDSLDPLMNTAAEAAVPSAAPEGTETNAAKISGWSMTCRQVSK